MSGIGPTVVRAAEIMRQAEEATERIAEAYEAADATPADSATVDR